MIQEFGERQPYKTINIIRYFPREVKYLWQRYKQGWCDYDIYNLDSHLAMIIPQMLKRISEEEQIPGEFEDYQQWRSKLLMIAGDIKAWRERDHANDTKSYNRLLNRTRRGIRELAKIFPYLWY